jgi:N-acetylglucosamine kinase-like BadF-type ATPase
LRTTISSVHALNGVLAYAFCMRFVLGFDGGGTKTDCVLMDESGAILARSQAGPSNPLRVGFGAAITAIRAAARQALAEAALPEGVASAALCAGLAGAGPPESAEKLHALLAAEFPESKVQVSTDVALALAAAGEGPVIVLLAGTGSFSVGRNTAGETARAGGYGSQIGDEGSAYDIGRRAVLTAMHENDRSGMDSLLGQRLLRELGCADWNEVKARAQAASDEVFPRLFAVVATVADWLETSSNSCSETEARNLAQGILRAAALDLTSLTENLAERLHLRGTRFAIAKTGGMFGRSKFLENQIDERLKSAFPEAEIGVLRVSPAEAAARIALRLLSSGNVTVEAATRGNSASGKARNGEATGPGDARRE